MVLNSVRYKVLSKASPLVLAGLATVNSLVSVSGLVAKLTLKGLVSEVRPPKWTVRTPTVACVLPVCSVIVW